jgi:hypothetical protein
MGYYVEQLKRVTIERTTLAAAIVVMGVAATGLLGAIYPIISTDETDSPWVGHRWEPVLLASAFALVLAGVVLLTPTASLGQSARIALVAIAAIGLAVSAVAWQDRATGTKSQFLDAYSSLDFGPGTSAAPMAYVAGKSAGFDTAAAPRGNKHWLVSTSPASACPALAQTASNWAGGPLEDYVPIRTAGSDCFFEVRRGQFDIMFSGTGSSSGTPWTLTALMQPVG